MKRGKLLIFCIIILTTLIVSLIILLGVSVARKNKKPYDKDESNSTIVNTLATDFLIDMSSGSLEPYYNILDGISSNDEVAFESIIKYLYAKGMYTKNDNNYVFKQSDIKKVASTYLMKDNFSYITTNENYKYIEENKTFTTSLPLELEESYTINKVIEIYEKTESKVYVIYEITIYGVDKISKRYNITLENNNNKFKIIEIN